MQTNIRPQPTAKSRSSVPSAVFDNEMSNSSFIDSSANTSMIDMRPVGSTGLLYFLYTPVSGSYSLE